MGALAKFLLSAASLAKKGVKESEILEFAKREFGDVSEFMRAKIRKIFKNKDAPSIKNPAKQEGEVVPFKKDQASGIMASDEASPLMKRLSEGAQMLKGMKQSGMNPTVALTKTLARSILNKKGIQVPDRVDPIEVLVENFGADVLMDTRNIADELLELQRMGKGTKGIDEVLEQEGMFDIQINKDAPKGLSQEELRQIKKEVDQEKMFEDFDPTDRDPNAMGGIMRANYKIGSGIKLAKFLASKGKNLKQEIKNAVDNIFTTGDSKYDADVALDSMLEELDVDRDMFDQKDIIDAYGMAYQQLTAPIIKNLKTPKGTRPTKPEKSIKSMKETGSMDISDPEIASEFDRFMKETDPEGYKKMEEAMKKAADEAQPLEYVLGTRKKNSEGGLNYLMGM